MTEPADFGDRVDAALAAVWRGQTARFPQTNSQVGFAGRSTLAIHPSMLNLDSSGHYDPLEHGAVVGDYVIGELLGAGGMGAVYAVQHLTTERSAALKVVRDGLRASQVDRDRFQLEVRALSRIQHPGIATLYEVGTTDDGLPYFVMERVDGVRLDQHVADRGCTSDEIVRLVASCARAVASAHQRGVMHMDLKPSNVLVDAQGAPRVLDFGLAQFTSIDEDQPRDVVSPDVAGTLPYMAPEQLAEEPSDVDTRTDVHALGVILYQMLTGQLPVPVAGLSVSEAAAAIVNVVPNAPSTHAPGLDGDLDLIVGRALAKRPADRYATADALADDLDRCLARLPIEARRDSLLYRVDRFVRRRTRLTVFIAAAILVVLAAWVATGWALVTANRAEETARREATKSQATLGFVTDLFSRSSPELAGHDVTLREYLESKASAIGQLEARGSADDDTLAVLYGAVGRAFLAIGRLEEARTNLQRAVELLARSRDEDARATALRDLGFCLHAIGDLKAAEPVQRDALRRREALFEPHHPKVLQSREELATLLVARGEYDRARPLILENVRAARQVGHQQPQLLAGQLLEFAEFCFETSGYGDAEPAAREALKLLEVSDADSRSRLRALRLLSQSFSSRGMYEEAQPALEQALELARAALEPGDLELARLHEQLGRIAHSLESEEAALEHYRQVVKVRESRLGPRAPEVLAARKLSERYRRNCGDLQGAVDGLSQLLTDCREYLPEHNPITAEVAAELAMALTTVDQHAAASELLDSFGDVIHEDHLPLQARYYLLSARSWVAYGTPEAVEVARTLFEFTERHMGAGHMLARSSLRSVMYRLAEESQFEAALRLGDERIEFELRENNPSGVLQARAAKILVRHISGDVSAIEDAQALQREIPADLPYRSLILDILSFKMH